MEFIKRRLPKGKCGNCKFFDVHIGAWKRNDGEIEAAHGYCRIHSPIRSDNSSGEWPYVSDDDWCGEWEQKVK